MHPNHHRIDQALTDHVQLVNTLREHTKELSDISEAILQCFTMGSKVLLCGNGGSAGDSMHIAAEFVGRFRGERHSLPALSLAADPCVVSCIANDYGYEKVFSRQVEGLGKPGDIVFGLTTSGQSSNVIEALRVAQERGMKTVALTGSSETKLHEYSDYSIRIKSTETARIQELHILVGHIICELIDESSSSPQPHQINAN